MESIINKIGYKLYWLIFKEEPSENAKIFIGNLWYVAVGLGFYAIFSFMFQIMAGRFLGPIEYGKYALIQSVAIFLSIPMNLGISTALIKYNAESEDQKRQSEIILTSCITAIVLSCFFSLVFLFFSGFLSKIFNVPVYFLFLAVIFAFISNFYLVITSIFRSLHKNRQYSFFQSIYGLIILSLLLLFILKGNLSFESAVFSIYFAYFLVSILAILRLRKYFSTSFSWLWMKIILKYGLYATIGGIAFAFLSNFNLILINKYIDTFDVGVYNAYYFSSIAILYMILNVFVTVFFPTVSKYSKKQQIFQKVDKALPVLFLLGVPFFFVVEFLVLKLYGGKYPINYLLMFESTIAGVLIVGYGCYDWLFASHGGLGVKFMALSGVIVALVNVVLALFLIPKIGISGAMISLGIAYFVGILNYKFLKHKIA